MKKFLTIFVVCFLSQLWAEFHFVESVLGKCSGPSGVAKVVDWNSDGSKDIIFGCGSKLYIYVQRENFVYETIIKDYPLSEIVDFAVGDFDHDGYNDIVIANYYNLDYLRGQGDEGIIEKFL